MTSSKAHLSVAEYSDVVIKTYLHGGFDPSADSNLTQAAEEFYALLRKLVDAASGKSEDAKAPLKGIRRAIDAIVKAYPEGPASPEVESLFQLCRRLEELCQERMATGPDVTGAQQVHDQLRYRLTRLVAGDGWTQRPELRLRVLQLIFSFMVADNERLAEEGRGQPNLKLGRTLSLGRALGGGRSLGPRRVSKWNEALDEIAKLPGTKLMPLMKLLLLDNMQMHGDAAATAATDAAASPGTGQPLTPGQTVTAVGAPVASSPEVTAVNASLLNDLLGLSPEGPAAGGTSASRRSASPAPSSQQAPGDDPFAGMNAGYDTRYSTPPSEGGSSHLSAHMARMTLAPGLPPTHPGQQYTRVHTPTQAFPIGAPGHFGGGSSVYSGSGGTGVERSRSGSLPPPSPAGSALQRASSGPLVLGQPAGGYSNSQGSPMMWGLDVSQGTPHNSMADRPHFDAASPYLGVANPFNGQGNFFRDVAPELPPRGPAPPPAAPAMRSPYGHQK